MFTSVQNRGFKLQFDNGWTISVQFGPGNYCDRQRDAFDAPMKELAWSSENAEIAAWNKDERWWDFDNAELLGPGETGVHGWVDANTVSTYINLIATM